MSIECCQLTTKDYTIIEVMLERYANRADTMSAILRQKISKAVVMFRDDIPPTVVTLSSRVAYRVNDGPADTRIIAHDEMRGLTGMILPITNPRGLALLGLAEGESMTIAKADGTREKITVQQVLYQPEAAKRESATTGRAPGPSPTRKPALRVVHRSDSLPDRSARKAMSIGDAGFDDPGPSAA